MMCNHPLLSAYSAKDGDYQDAIDSFERALDFAKLQEDKAAERAIQRALKDINDTIARGLSDSQQGN